MKKTLAWMLAALLALFCGAGVAEVGLANPWSETTAQALLDEYGLALGVPEGATDVSWRVLESEQLAEMTFTWDGLEYTARVKPADAFEDISGMYFEWEQQMDCKIGRCDGVCYRSTDGENTVDLCLWYDELTGLMYSVGVEDRDLDGFDIQAAADQLFIPMQTE